VQLKYAEKIVSVFVISPRTTGLDAYWNDVHNTIRWSEQHECTGMLIFTGNDVYLDPFSVAQFLLERTKRLSPLIAVNPVYCHPFTAARMIASLAFIYRRKIFLNMVTGTALSHLESLGDSLTHDARYERIGEYISIIKALTSNPRPLSVDGRVYKTCNLQLPFCISPELKPEFVLAGQSSAAQSVCETTGATGMEMLSSKLDHGVNRGRGIHFGVVTRPEKDQAWQVARRLYPCESDARTILDLSMLNTDSVWKMRMKYEADQPSVCESGYWLEPFRNCRADCPYFIGSYQEVAALISQLVRCGAEMFIMDIPAVEEEYFHVSRAFKLAQVSLDSSAHPAVAMCGFVDRHS
jgi:alkanesulfonate monooxygenase